MSKLIFVYGTLKAGCGNSHILNQSPLLGAAKTVGSFLLTNVGFPYLIPEEDLTDGHESHSKPVVGEVYEVEDSTTLERLDSLEGVGYGHYKHKTIEVVLEGHGEAIEVVAYTPCDPTHAQDYPYCGINGEGAYEWT